MPSRHAFSPCRVAPRALPLAAVLLACGHDATGPRPLRGQLLFERGEPNYMYAIAAMADTGGPQHALTAPLADVESPAVSPDGRHVAYVYRFNDIRIYVQGVDRVAAPTGTPVGASLSGARTLTPAPYNAQIDPNWSADGRQIAFSNYQKIYVVDAAGDTNPRVAYTSPTPIRGVAWSPDGTKFAFSLTTDTDERIAVVNADGTGLQSLTSGGQDYFPAWSPDGRKIAFAHVIGYVGSSTAITDVFVMNTDGTGMRRLTNTPGHGNSTPSWSPDGNRIAFSSSRDGNGEIYVMNADGSGQTNLTRTPTIDESGPVWTPPVR